MKVDAAITKHFAEPKEDVTVTVNGHNVIHMLVQHILVLAIVMEIGREELYEKQKRSKT